MTDTVLRQDVVDALEFEPRIDAADIGVAVEDGVVTLTGHVRTYSEKLTAERIALRIKGVKAVAQEIEVRPSGAHPTADDEIARRVLDSLRWNAMVPKDAIKAKVANGWVTLSGKVKWHYEKDAAERSINHLLGVRGVSNNVEITPSVRPDDVHRRIEDALKRDAELEARAIRVEVKDRSVTLEGKVKSWAERRSAERAAWAAPGVTDVIDHIAVGN